MGIYTLLAKVDQIVTREVQLLVTARSEEEAQELSRKALSEFPKPVTTDGINRVVVNKANYWIPKSIEFTRIEKEKEAA